MLGGAVSTAIPIFGSLLGPALGAIGSGFKKLFGIGVNDEVKKWNAEIQKLRDGLIAQHGSLDALEKKANAVGLSFKAAWGHQNQAGLKAFSDLIAEFEQKTGEAAEAHQKLVDDLAAAKDELSGLREEGTLTWQKLQEQAEFLGADIRELGPAFNQQRLTSQLIATL